MKAKFPGKPIKVPDVDCSKLFAGDKEELQRVKVIERAKVPDINVTNDVKRGCDAFLDNHGFVTSSLTAAERDFPIAYSMLVYKDAAQVCVCVCVCVCARARAYMRVCVRASVCVFV